VQQRTDSGTFELDFERNREASNTVWSGAKDRILVDIRRNNGITDTVVVDALAFNGQNMEGLEELGRVSVGVRELARLRLSRS
jgi:hypothetical protein